MVKKLINIFGLVIISILWLGSCKTEPMEIVIDVTPYVLNYGGLSEPVILEDNILTVQGVQLGRMLFYEDLVSKYGTQSCSTCHHQPDGFSDSLQFSIGVEMLPGKRQAIQVAPTTDAALVSTRETGLFLTDEDKVDLVNFLHTLTDETYLNNPAYKIPF